MCLNILKGISNRGEVTHNIVAVLIDNDNVSHVYRAMLWYSLYIL